MYLDHEVLRSLLNLSYVRYFCSIWKMKVKSNQKPLSYGIFGGTTEVA